MRRLAQLAVAVLCGAGSLANGQGSAPTTVQLPTFHVFTVQTTVSVPDRGSLPLGGITRGADGRVQLGPLGSRTGGTSRGSSRVSATATIHDQRELDAAVLAAAALPRIDGPVTTQAAALSRHVASPGSHAPAGSVAAILAQNAAADEARNAEWELLLAKGEQAAARGEAGLAKTYFGIVARRAGGALRQRARALLSDVGREESSLSRR